MEVSLVELQHRSPTWARRQGGGGAGPGLVVRNDQDSLTAPPMARLPCCLAARAWILWVLWGICFIICVFLRFTLKVLDANFHLNDVHGVGEVEAVGEEHHGPHLVTWCHALT